MSSGAIPNLSVTADQAAKAVALAQRRQRVQRRLPPVAPSIQAFSNEHQIYIFNVGPWDHHVMLGSWGVYYIPPCESGKAYAGGNPIPGIYHEPIPVNESNFQLEGIEGSYVADQILGVGKNLAWNKSLLQLGVFRSDSATPTRDEIAQAKALLFEEYERLFDEAQTAFAQGPKEFKDLVGDGTKHKLAARELGRADVGWVQNANVGKKIPCMNCGTFVEPQVISCPQCTFILDVERYEKEIAPRLAKHKMAAK